MGYINSGKELTSLWVHKEMQSTEGTTVMEDTTKNTGTTLYSEGLNTQERPAVGMRGSLNTPGKKRDTI